MQNKYCTARVHTSPNSSRTTGVLTSAVEDGKVAKMPWQTGKVSRKYWDSAANRTFAITWLMKKLILEGKIKTANDVKVEHYTNNGLKGLVQHYNAPMSKTVEYFAINNVLRELMRSRQ